MRSKAEVRTAFIWIAFLIGAIGLEFSFLLEFPDFFDATPIVLDYIQIGSSFLVAFALSNVLKRGYQKRGLIVCAMIGVVLLIILIVVSLQSKSAYVEWISKIWVGISLSVVLTLAEQWDQDEDTETN